MCSCPPLAGGRGPYPGRGQRAAVSGRRGGASGLGTAASYLEQGSAAFWRANLALFLGGWVTFACLYSTQPVLPALTAEFGVPPALASLSVSVTTATLAVT